MNNTSPLRMVLAVFSGLCLFAALTSFVTGFGHLKLGRENYYKEGAKIRINSGLASGDPLLDKVEREQAAISDREETAHGKFNFIVGGLLLIPAVLVWAKRRKEK